MKKTRFTDNDTFQEVPGMRDNHPIMICKKLIRDDQLSFGAMGFLIALLLAAEKEKTFQENVKIIFEREDEKILQGYMTELVENNYLTQLDGSKEINSWHPNLSV